jgi:ATP-dependent helicase Lhr and Lhr-like helicase
VPMLYVDRGGRGILRLAELAGAELEAALAELSKAVSAGIIGKLEIERLDGEPVIGSPHEATVIAAGFSRQPRRLVARAR